MKKIIKFYLCILIITNCSLAKPDQYQDIMFKLNVLEKCISIYFYAKLELSNKGINQDDKAKIVELLQILKTFMSYKENGNFSKDKFNKLIDKSVGINPDIFNRLKEEATKNEKSNNLSLSQTEKDRQSFHSLNKNKSNSNIENLTKNQDSANQITTGDKIITHEKNKDLGSKSNQNEDIEETDEINEFTNKENEYDNNSNINDDPENNDFYFEDFQLSQKEFLNLINTGLFLSQAEFLPHYKQREGTFDGWLVNKIDEMSTLHQMGITDGDIIQSINHIDFVDLSKTYLDADLYEFLSLYKNLTQSNVVNIKVLRNEQPIILQTNLRK